MQFGLLLPTLAFLLGLAAQAEASVQTLAHLQSTIADRSASDDNFCIEGVVAHVPDRLSDVFSITDGRLHILMTDGARWPEHWLRRGDRIRASGVVKRHADNPKKDYAKAFQIEIIGHEELPPPARATARQIFQGDFVNREFTVAGTVVDAFRDEIDPRFVFLILFSEGEYLYLSSPYTNDVSRLADYNGSEVAVTGFCRRLYKTNSRNKIGLQISVRIPEGLVILRPRAKDPFLAPDLSGTARDVRAAAESGSPWRKTCGRVVAVRPDQVYARTAEDNLARILLVSERLPAPGDEIEAVGMPETDLHNLNLSRALWRKTGTGEQVPCQAETVAARTLCLDDSGNLEFKPTYHGRTIRLRGTVQRIKAESQGFTSLTIDDDGFQIPIDIGPLAQEIAGLCAGCQIEATGVCIMETDNWRPQAPFPHIRSVSLIANAADSIRILAQPPWWTPMRLTTVIVVLIVLVLATLTWVLLLQRISDRKGRALAKSKLAESESALKVQERTRLATELHDGIVQSMTGASLKLRAADRLRPSSPAEARRQFDLALKTIDACRTEIRNCIWDLRSRALDEDTMDGALRRTLTPLFAEAKITIRFSVPRNRLTDNTVHALICIVRELAVNAIRHGKASVIRIAGCVDGDRILFSVQDNGCGFDLARTQGPDQGHFGLQGIRERVDMLRGTFELSSEPGAGTKASVSLKLANEGKR